MSVQDLNRVHRRYITLSNTFKSAWTFHQFVQGLRKVFTDINPSSYPADFQSIYNELKQVPDNLSETTSDTAAAQLDTVDHRLAPLVLALLSVDEEISPALLRQFFQRVKNYDDNILTQLVKFYLYSKGDGDWPLDRLDKADFLTTKLAEEYQDGRDAFVVRDPTAMREAAQGFWAALGVTAMSQLDTAAVCDEIGALEQEIAASSSVDDLSQQNLVQRFRDLKHGLGDSFFQPKILHTIIGANLVMKNQIHQLYRRDEQRIIAEYQQVFELERDVPVDVQLGEELSQFRLAVERFEGQLQEENVRLKEVAQLREKVRELVPRLQPSGEAADTPFVQPREARDFLGEREEEDGEPPPAPTAFAAADDYVEEWYQAIIGALDDTNPTHDAKKVTLQPEVFALGIGPREIVAYRRLFGAATCDQGLEQLVLRAAALRARIEQEVEEIKGILDDTAVTRDAPVFAKARVTSRMGDLYLRRFDHRIEQAVLESDVVEARSLQQLKMRMMRAYSGLWLMVHRD